MPDLRGLILIGSPNCGPCANSSRWLHERGVEFRKIRIDNDERLQRWVLDQTGQRTVPQFFWNGQWLSGGFPVVQQLVQNGTIPSGQRR